MLLLFPAQSLQLPLTAERQQTTKVIGEAETKIVAMREQLQDKAEEAEQAIARRSLEVGGLPLHSWQRELHSAELLGQRYASLWRAAVARTKDCERRRIHMRAVRMVTHSVSEETRVDTTACCLQPT